MCIRDRPVKLSLDGAATMIQSVGGFLVDLKYGEMSSQWYDNSDGMVTYGIGSVSYTHLDVYKRQVPMLFLIK